MKKTRTTKLETRSLWERIGAQSYLWLLLIVLYAPILLIIIFSFTQSKVFGNWEGFTFGLYQNLFTGYDATANVQVDPNLYRAILYTIVIAFSSAIIPLSFFIHTYYIKLFNLGQKLKPKKIEITF